MDHPLENGEQPRNALHANLRIIGLRYRDPTDIADGFGACLAISGSPPTVYSHFRLGSEGLDSYFRSIKNGV